MATEQKVPKLQLDMVTLRTFVGRGPSQPGSRDNITFSGACGVTNSTDGSMTDPETCDHTAYCSETCCISY
jgi:hypothetical protein